MTHPKQMEVVILMMQLIVQMMTVVEMDVIKKILKIVVAGALIENQIWNLPKLGDFIFIFKD